MVNSSDKEIVENISSGKLILFSSVIEASVQTENTVKDYYLNADPNTKNNYPLILCKDDNDCTLTAVAAAGYLF